MMRSAISAVIAFCFLSLPVWGEEKVVTLENVSEYIGQEVLFQGYVEQVHTIESGMTFLDFGGRHPNATFTAVIFVSDLEKFPQIKDFQFQEVQIRGIVNEFRARPQIRLSAPDQISLAKLPENSVHSD